jgi:hypothetical protein
MRGSDLLERLGCGGSQHKGLAFTLGRKVAGLTDDSDARDNQDLQGERKDSKGSATQSIQPVDAPDWLPREILSLHVLGEQLAVRVEIGGRRRVADQGLLDRVAIVGVCARGGNSAPLGNLRLCDTLVSWPTPTRPR